MNGTMEMSSGASGRTNPDFDQIQITNSTLKLFHLYPLYPQFLLEFQKDSWVQARVHLGH
jgi:hypothetical protein